MKKIEINVNINVSNGEWQDGKKIERNWEQSHVIDLDLLNDENTFQAVKADWEREFQTEMEKAVNTVIQRMLDNKPDKPAVEKTENK